MIDLLCLLLYPALLGLSNPKKYWFFIPITLLAWIVDFIANYTIISILIMAFPKQGEYTFSQRLGRLVKESGPDQQLFVEIAKKLNRIDPLHNHISLGGEK